MLVVISGIRGELSPCSTRMLVHSIAKATPTLFVLALMFGGWLLVHQIDSGNQPVSDEVKAVDTATDTLTLPLGKLQAGRFETVPAQSRPIQHVHQVPGRIRYDESKHLDIKAPMDGILTELTVTPGEQVPSGHLLAVLRSPEIGQARAEILKRQKQGEIAQQLLERESLLAVNLERLSSMLDGGQSIEAIEAAFANRALGSYRQEILSAYSKMKLSIELLANVAQAANSGSISGRVLLEREADRQVSETAFRTARDQATFAANQAKLMAESDVAEAERQVNLAWQAVETLLGYKEDRKTANLSDEDALSRLEIRAPIAGSVESRGFASNERVSRGDSLLVLANTDSLYVAASIREGDWPAVALQPGTAISFTVPALEDRTFEASIRYIGREVKTDTNSVPLIATVPNGEGLLRPGMFVRVTIPIGKMREALSVKAESVVQHENKQFVFVDMKGGTFQRVNITTGVASQGWIEVTEGLDNGDPVVTDGAFLLKSELLLHGEGE